MEHHSLFENKQLLELDVLHVAKQFLKTLLYFMVYFVMKIQFYQFHIIFHYILTQICESRGMYLWNTFQ